MKKVLSLLVAITSLVLILMSCDSDEKHEVKTLYRCICENIYWEGNPCGYTEYYKNYSENRAIIINKAEDIEKYIKCEEGDFSGFETYTMCGKGEFSDIDFSKQTLLLAMFSAPYSVDYIEQQLLQITTDEYELNIVVILGDAAWANTYVVAFVTNKLSEKSNIKLITEAKRL